MTGLSPQGDSLHLVLKILNKWWAIPPALLPVGISNKGHHHLDSLVSPSSSHHHHDDISSALASTA